jgi:CHU_C Type IX secretion signal domain
MCRKIVLLIFLLVFVGMNTHAQTSISDCEGAILLCGDLYTETQASFNTGNIYEATGSCNQGLEQSSVWYTFTVQQAGALSFILDPLNDNDDYDWGLFDITNGGCAGLGTTSPEVQCNSYGVIGVNGPTGISTANGGFGNSNGPGDLNGPAYNGDFQVTLGSTYALVVMNWSNSLDGYTIDFGQSTASLYDQVPPTPISATIDCNNLNIDLVFSEGIISTSAQPTDFSITGPGGTYSISNVVPGNSTMASDFAITLTNPILIGGTYTLNITNTDGFVEDACGNLGTQSITFEVLNPITFSSVTTTACNGFGGTASIENISGGDGNYSLTFNGTSQNQWSFTNLPAGTYNAVISDGTGCSQSASVIVPNQDIQITIPPQDSLSCLNPNFPISGLVVTPTQNIIYAWSESNLSNTNTPNPVVSSPGIYTVTVTNTENGCADTEQIEIAAGEVYALDLSTLVLPNIITREADGRNDNWRAILGSQPSLDLTLFFLEYDLVVYNRWGGLVFESSETSKIWDASDVENGTYFFIFHFATDCGTVTERTIEGTILVKE